MKSLPKEVQKGDFSMVPKSKMSKKARAELNKQQRVTWNFSPVSRIKPSAKIYNRKRKDVEE